MPLHTTESANWSFVATANVPSFIYRSKLLLKPRFLLIRVLFKNCATVGNPSYLTQGVLTLYKNNFYTVKSSFRFPIVVVPPGKMLAGGEGGAYFQAR